MLVKQFPNTAEMIELSTPRNKKNEVYNYLHDKITEFCFGEEYNYCNSCTQNRE
jgi:hypothetical protein